MLIHVHVFVFYSNFFSEKLLFPKFQLTNTHSHYTCTVHVLVTCALILDLFHFLWEIFMFFRFVLCTCSCFQSVLVSIVQVMKVGPYNGVSVSYFWENWSDSKIFNTCSINVILLQHAFTRFVLTESIFALFSTFKQWTFANNLLYGLKTFSKQRTYYNELIHVHILFIFWLLGNLILKFY